jgi:deazaflavin-dependent oxidoreductase (nitroreductase family)
MSTLAEKAMGLFIRAHDAVYQRTDGWIGHRIPFAPPMLLLHSVGAKTGRPRTHSLAYYRDGADYLVVASNGGAPRNPAWYHNLRAHPDVDINLGHNRIRVNAHPVLPGDPDYPRLWRLCDEANGGRYGAYQQLTTRPIPVIRLRLVRPRPTTPVRPPRPASPG